MSYSKQTRTGGSQQTCRLVRGYRTHTVLCSPFICHDVFCLSLSYTFFVSSFTSPDTWMTFLFLLLSHLTHTRLVIIIYDSIGEISPGLEGLERQHQPIDTPAGPTKATNRNVYQEGARTRAGQRRPWAHREVRPVFCFCCCFVYNRSVTLTLLSEKYFTGQPWEWGKKTCVVWHYSHP